MGNLQSDSPYKGSGSLTREQFLFYEMRTTARLMCEGLEDTEIETRIYEENLFQYPTERMIRSMVKTCIGRLRGLDDDTLVSTVAGSPAEEAKQICLYAMMRKYRLVRDFMVTVIGEKYRLLDMSFGKMDVNVFLMSLQEQDDYVAGWSDATVAKIRQVLMRLLVENAYMDSIRSDHLNPVLISPVLENAIRADGQERLLPAFNCLY